MEIDRRYYFWNVPWRLKIIPDVYSIQEVNKTEFISMEKKTTFDRITRYEMKKLMLNMFEWT